MNMDNRQSCVKREMCAGERVRISRLEVLLSVQACGSNAASAQGRRRNPTHGDSLTGLEETEKSKSGTSQVEHARFDPDMHNSTVVSGL